RASNSVVVGRNGAGVIACFNRDRRKGLGLFHSVLDARLDVFVSLTPNRSISRHGSLLAPYSDVLVSDSRPIVQATEATWLSSGSCPKCRRAPSTPRRRRVVVHTVASETSASVELVIDSATPGTVLGAEVQGSGAYARAIG